MSSTLFFRPIDLNADDVDSMFESVHTRPPRGTRTLDEYREARRIRRGAPTAKAKARTGRIARKIRREVMLEQWFAREGEFRAFVLQCYVLAASPADKQMCAQYMYLSDRAVEFARKTLPGSFCERLNGFRPWSELVDGFDNEEFF